MFCALNHSFISLLLNAITVTLAVAFVFIKWYRKSCRILSMEYIVLFIAFAFIYFIGGISSDSFTISRLLSMTCLLGYYLFSINYYDDVYTLIQDINTALFAIIVLSTILYLIGVPEAFYRENASLLTFKGAATNRNSYAEITLFFLVTNFCIYSKKRNIVRLVLCHALAIITTVMTRSATATICITILTVLLLLILNKFLSSHFPFAAFLVFYVFAFCAIMAYQGAEFNGLEWILDAFNKNSTLTGRTNLWAAAFDAISEKLLFGYGFDSEVLLNYGAKYTDPHNSILYILLTQGIAGASVMVLVIFSIMLKSRSKKLKSEYLFCAMLAFVVVWMIRGLVESGLSYTHFAFWVSLIILE